MVQVSGNKYDPWVATVPWRKLRQRRGQGACEVGRGCCFIERPGRTPGIRWRWGRGLRARNQRIQEKSVWAKALRRELGCSWSSGQTTVGEDAGVLWRVRLTQSPQLPPECVVGALQGFEQRSSHSGWGLSWRGWKPSYPGSSWEARRLWAGRTGRGHPSMVEGLCSFPSLGRGHWSRAPGLWEVSLLSHLGLPGDDGWSRCFSGRVGDGVCSDPALIGSELQEGSRLSQREVTGASSLPGELWLPPPAPRDLTVSPRLVWMVQLPGRDRDAGVLWGRPGDSPRVV